MRESLQLLSKHFNFAIIAVENLLMLPYGGKENEEKYEDHF